MLISILLSGTKICAQEHQARMRPCNYAQLHFAHSTVDQASYRRIFEMGMVREWFEHGPVPRYNSDGTSYNIRPTVVCISPSTVVLGI